MHKVRFTLAALLALSLTIQLMPAAAVAKTRRPPILDLETLTGAQAVAMMARGKLTSVELTQAYFDRIAALNKRGPGLNAVTQLNADALKQAALADRQRAAGRVLGPAHGLPILSVSDAAMTLALITGPDPDGDAEYSAIFGPDYLATGVIPALPAQLPDYMKALDLNFVKGKKIGYNGTLTDGSPLKIAYDALTAAGAIMVPRPTTTGGSVLHGPKNHTPPRRSRPTARSFTGRKATFFRCLGSQKDGKRVRTVLHEAPRSVVEVRRGIRVQAHVGAGGE